MVGNRVYCIDVLTQVSAANAALSSFGKEILAEHIKTCVVNDIKNGSDEKVNELVETLLTKLMK